MLDISLGFSLNNPMIFRSNCFQEKYMGIEEKCEKMLAEAERLQSMVYAINDLFLLIHH